MLGWAVIVAIIFLGRANLDRWPSLLGFDRWMAQECIADFRLWWLLMVVVCGWFGDVGWQFLLSFGVGRGFVLLLMEV